MFELWQISENTPLFLLKKEYKFDKIYEKFIEISKTTPCAIVCTNLQKETFIYESPDNGKTVYKRKFGDTNNRILVKKEELN